MSGGRLDPVSLAAGVACVLVGGVLALDQLDVIALGAGLAAAAICAAAGSVLVVSGLSRPSTERAGERGDG